MGAAGSDDGTAEAGGQSQPQLRPPTRAWAGPREREGGNNGGCSAAFTVCGNNGGDSSPSSSLSFFSFIGKKNKIKEEKSWRAVVASRSTPRRKDRKMKVAYVQRVDLKSFLHFHFLVSSEHLTQLAYSSSVC